MPMIVNYAGSLKSVALMVSKRQLKMSVDSNICAGHRPNPA